jgi:chromosome transmission fidelity protein 18
LKPLRLVAQVITLRQPCPLHLSQRLRQVCELEGLKVDGKNLVDLVGAMEGDLRACLHALQFISATRKQIVGAGELLRCIQASGLKDIKRSSFALLQAVFHRPSASADALATEQLVRGISAEEDRFLEGCHELFLQAKFFDDAAMSKVNAALDWLSSADLWRSSASHPHLQRYTNYVPLKFRLLFASPTRSASIAFPREDFEVQQRTRAAQQILKTFLTGLPPSVLAGWGPVSCLIDRAPYLLGLIKPRIRVPNPQLLKPGEKIHLDRIVQIMANEGLTYRETKGSAEDNNNNYLFVLDPPIDVLVHLANPLAPPNQNLHPSHHHDSAIRKLVAHLVQQENIKRSQAHHKSAKALPAEPAVKKVEAPKVKLEPAPPAVKRDFFGRPIVPKHAPVSHQETPTPVPSSQPRVFYKFNEGFSNAVRRTIRIRDLFGPATKSED